MSHGQNYKSPFRNLSITIKSNCVEIFRKCEKLFRANLCFSRNHNLEGVFVSSTQKVTFQFLYQRIRDRHHTFPFFSSIRVESSVFSGLKISVFRQQRNSSLSPRANALAKPLGQTATEPRLLTLFR